MNQEADGAILAGLVERVRSLLLGLDRRDRLETAGEFVGWLQRQKREQLDDIARGMLLRVLRCAGDPVNYRILERLGRSERGQRCRPDAGNRSRPGGDLRTAQ